MTVLDEICTKKTAHIRSIEAQMPLSTLKAKIEDTLPALSFKNRIQDFIDQNKPALIAEVKKASPSKGLIRADFNPAEIASCYERAGAACVSVLTDTPYFQGEDAHFLAVKEAIKLPVIRKDFMVEPYQIYESRALGADCILLIMAALSTEQAQEMHGLAVELGMSVLVEVHTEEELHAALTLNPHMVGVNSRNLKTLDVDLQTARDLLTQIPADIIRVAESGIFGFTELDNLFQGGYNAFLVGESLMRQDDIETAVHRLLGTKST